VYIIIGKKGKNKKGKNEMKKKIGELLLEYEEKLEKHDFGYYKKSGEANRKGKENLFKIFSLKGKLKGLGISELLLENLYQKYNIG
jgi:hypothetical protein